MNKNVNRDLCCFCKKEITKINNYCLLTAILDKRPITKFICSDCFNTSVLKDMVFKEVNASFKRCPMQCNLKRNNSNLKRRWND